VVSFLFMRDGEDRRRSPSTAPMALVAPSPVLAESRRRTTRWLPEAAVLAACGVFMFVGGRTPPIALWDESRVAVNALEMHLSGHLSLITTYGFQPDLWNTKPPLLIWVMDLSMDLFGASEWAMRLPSMLAAMATLALTLSFARRATGSFWTGALAAGLLATSLVFFGEHGARTADYDALLCLFTTGYLYVLFFALHRCRPGWGAPLLAGALIGLAVLTKSIAGLMPGVGVPLYLLLVGRWRRPLQVWWLLGAAPVALACPAAYYVLREHAAPGYLKAVLYNDLSGRYTRALDSHAGPPWYYLNDLVAYGAFGGGWLAAVAPAGLAWTRGRARLALLYSLCVCAGLLGALSFSATKLLHYVMPVAPFLAIATAIALGRGLDTMRRARADGRLSAPTVVLAVALALGLLAVGVGRAVYFRTAWLPNREFQGEGLYGALFDRLAARGPESIRVVDRGILAQGLKAAGVPQDYAPQLDAYRELAEARGETVQRIPASSLAAQPTGALLASCDPGLLPVLARMGTDLARLPGCIAVRRR
jgi:4-amino-4-deoxy-L-arabinose transferase-like glycosyltransferase